MVCLLYGLVPGSRPSLYRENQVIEWATAVVLLAAAVVGARTLVRAGTGGRHPAWLVPGLAGLGFLEEVSWGVFWLGVKRPKLVDMSVDSVHDLVEIGVRSSGPLAPPWVVLVGAIVLVGGTCSVLAMSARVRRRVTSAAPWPFFALAIALGVVSQALDVAVHGDRLVRVIEEVLELDGALALLFAARRLGAITPRCRGPA